MERRLAQQMLYLRLSPVKTEPDHVDPCQPAAVRGGVCPAALSVPGGGQPADGPPAEHAKTESSARGRPLRLRFAALERIAGEDPAPPPSLLSRYRGNRLQLSYQLCISADGRVSSVRRRSGSADADSFMLSTLRAWRYPPQPANT